MSNQDYSAYPAERQFLLMEGCRVYVLAIQRKVKIENTHEGMHKFNKKEITIIHLYHGD